MKLLIPILILVIFIFSFTSVNAKLIIINTNKYEPVKENISIQKNITKTIIITTQKRIKNYNFDQTYYNFERNKRYDKKINDILEKRPNYEDKTATKAISLPIKRSSYTKYYECYNQEFNHYYKDYDFYNPCLG